MRRSFQALTLATLAAACTPTSTGPATGAKDPAGLAVAGPGDGGTTGVDNSPVAQPRSLVVLVRARNPKQTIEAVEKLVPMPQKLMSLLSKESDGMSDFLDFSESFDVAVGLDPSTRDIDDPKMLVAFGVPLRADFKGLLDVAEKEGQHVRQTGPGSYRLDGKSARDLSCEINSPPSRAPRMVCAEGPSAFRELAPWLSRTLPLTPMPADDVWMQASFGPFRELLLNALRREMDDGLGNARKELERAGIRDPELLDAPAIGARELTLALEEVDRFELGLRLDPQKPELTASGELSFRGNQAWVTKVLTGENGKQGPPPDAFWRLPKDSDSAFFGHSADPALFTGLRRTAKKGLAAGLDVAASFSNGLLTDADKQVFVALLDSVPSTHGVWASATGALPSLPGGAPGTQKPAAFTPAQAANEARNKVRGLIGWSTVSSEGDIKQMTTFLKNSSDTYARVLGMVKKEADDKLRRASPDMKEFYKKRRAELDRAPRVRFVSDPPGYPKGSAQLEFDFDLQSDDVWSWVHPERDWDARPEHPKGRASKSTLAIRMAVAPDEAGRYVWGYAADANVLKEKLLSARAAGAKDKTLAARTDLERLKAPASQAGFISYGRILEKFAGMDEHDRDLKELSGLIKQLPNYGSSPVFFRGGGKAGGTPSVAITLSMGKAWIEDIGAIVRLAQSRSGRAAPPEAVVSEEKVVPAPKKPAPTAPRK